MDTFTIAPGSVFERTVQLRDALNRALADTYAGTEPLEIEAWQGDDRAPVDLGSAAATWADAGAGRVLVRIPAADTAGLAGAFRLRLYLTDAGDRLLAWECFCDIDPAPDPDAAEPVVYCSFGDVRDLAPYVVDLIARTPHLQADLGDLRARARSTLDDIILACDRPEWTRGIWGYSGNTVLRSGSWYGFGGDIPPNPTLRGWLDEDRLIVRLVVREITARLALAFLLEPMIGASDDGPTWNQLGSWHRRHAYNRIAGYMAELDLSDPADGIADYWVRCGTVTAR